MLVFDWDEEKNRGNKAKHGVSFERARAVFADRAAVDLLDAREDYGEERWVTVGMAQGELLAVVNTQRGDSHRLISARKATREETDAYFENASGT
jgi:uncharacterized DUF497 family protein